MLRRRRCVVLLVQDGRLRVDDQLVDVNGTSLLGMDNARAVQVLREAMMKDGRVHGFIGITVSRPRNSAARSTTPCREVRVSQADNEDVSGGTVSTLPRPCPVQRLTAVAACNKDAYDVADALSVSLPANVAQVEFIFTVLVTQSV